MNYTDKLLLVKPIESYPSSVNEQLALVSFYKKKRQNYSVVIFTECKNTLAIWMCYKDSHMGVS